MIKKREKNPKKQYKIYQRKSSNSTTSLDRATKILTCLVNEIDTANEISSFLEYSTSTVHRLLQSLKRLKWVVQDEFNHKFYLGPMITQLASDRIAAHKYLIMHARREMLRLSEFTEETVNLNVMVQMHYMLLHEISSLHDVKISEASKKLGQQFNGATAKVLFSQLEPEEMKVALKQIKIQRATENTVTDKKLLMKQIEEIWRQGYCVSIGERIPGAMCISVPIRYNYPACLSVVGPENRLRPKASEVIEELKTSVSRISSDINAVFSQKEGI
jgi:IclR family KDG regulon transcriptional repressor